MTLFGWLAVLLAIVGCAQSMFGPSLAWRFARQARHARTSTNLPPVTVLKPLHGAPPGLAGALESVFRQDYPNYQIVFGVQKATDPAIAIVDDLRSRYPHVEATLVISDPRPGRNRKVANLIGMQPHAAYRHLVIADADIVVPPDWIADTMNTLAGPGTGLATCVYTGTPANGSLAAILGATGITYGFLPGALAAHYAGRQDCFGATMAIAADDLARAGGLARLLDHVADDHVLGHEVAALGLRVALCRRVVSTVVAERTMSELFFHELRWARTIRKVAPLAFAASGAQHAIGWAALATVLSGASGPALAVLGLACFARVVGITVIDATLPRPAPAVPLWIAIAAAPIRDLFSLAIFFTAFLSADVRWAGQRLTADDGGLRQPRLPVVAELVETE